MRPVNLLPERERPTRASGERSGSAFFVIGALGVALVAVLAYVLTANQVSSRERETQKVEGEAVAATARAAKLAAFGDFAQIKATREASVTQLAAGRIDWERTLRELARLLPSDVHVTSLEASATGEGTSSSAAAAAPSGPQVKLLGCAPSHRDVATTLVRLRRLHGAEDVKLADSTKSEDGSAAGGAGGNTAGGTAQGSGGCPPDETAFQATVVLKPAASIPPAKTKVPASLGGGS